MATVEELVVRAKPSGLDETSQGFEDMQEDLEETEEQMDETAGEFDGLRNKWLGALGAIVGGLAVAVGGVLTQVPVLGQAMSGLGAIVNGLAIQLDKRLRPALMPVTQGLFQLGNAIAAGNWGEAKNQIGGFASALANVNWGSLFNSLIQSVVDLRGKVLDELANLLTPENVESILKGIGETVDSVNWGEAFSQVVSDTKDFYTSVDWVGIAATIVTTVAGGIADKVGEINWSKKLSDIVDALSGITESAIDVIDSVNWQEAAISFVFGLKNELEKWIGKTDWSGLAGDATDGFISKIEDIDWMQLGKDIINFLIDGIEAFAEWQIGVYQDVGEWLYNASGLKDAVQDAKQWGKDLIDRFIKGIEAKIKELDKKLEKVEGKIEDKLSFDMRENDKMAERWGSDMTSHFAKGMEMGASNLPNTTDVISQGRSLRVDAGQPQVIMDGRDVTSQTGRYRRDETSRRGRDS